MDQAGNVWGGREMGVRVGGGGRGVESGREGRKRRRICPSPVCIPTVPALVRESRPSHS